MPSDCRGLVQRAMAAPVAQRHPTGAGPCSHLDPLLEQADLFVAQFALRRHFHIGIGVADGSDQSTVSEVAGDDGRPTLSAAPRGSSGIEPQPTTGFAGFGRVAFVAMFRKQRPDLRFKKLDRGRIVAESAMRPNGCCPGNEASDH